MLVFTAIIFSALHPVDIALAAAAPAQQIPDTTNYQSYIITGGISLVVGFFLGCLAHGLAFWRDWINSRRQEKRERRQRIDAFLIFVQRWRVDVQEEDPNQIQNVWLAYRANRRVALSEAQRIRTDCTDFAKIVNLIKSASQFMYPHLEAQGGNRCNVISDAITPLVDYVSEDKSWKKH